MTFQLTILGTSAALPYKNRFLSGQILNVHEELFLKLQTKMNGKSCAKFMVKTR